MRVSDVVGDGRVVLVVLETDELGVDESVFDESMSKQFHDVQDVSGSVVFHGGFPMSERVEVYLEQSWVLKFVGDSLSGDGQLGANVLVAC